MRTHRSQTTKLMKVLCVQPLLSEPLRLHQLTGDVILPPVFYQLFRDMMESPWSFLKLGLMLSLVDG
jgi:hypothetical protein